MFGREFDSRHLHIKISSFLLSGKKIDSNHRCGCCFYFYGYIVYSKTVITNEYVPFFNAFKILE